MTGYIHPEVLVSTDWVAEHLNDKGGITLVGDDGKGGLLGGEKPESESFSVRFNGSNDPGTYAAAVRIVTQAGNLGVSSAGGGAGVSGSVIRRPPGRGGEDHTGSGRIWGGGDEVVPGDREAR